MPNRADTADDLADTFQHRRRFEAAHLSVEAFDRLTEHGGLPLEDGADLLVQKTR